MSGGRGLPVMLWVEVRRLGGGASAFSNDISIDGHEMKDFQMKYGS